MTSQIVLPHLSDGSLIVRTALFSDVPAILAFLEANREAFTHVEPRRPERYYTAEFCHMRVALNQSQFDEGRSVGLFVFEPDNDTVIGTINFSNLVGYPYHGATLGYSLAQEQWGQGRMYRALRLALDWIFSAHNLHRISANHLPDNLRSGKLLAKLGFQREGYAIDYLLINGIWRDHVLTALTSASWVASGSSQQLVVNGNGKLPSNTLSS